MRRCKTKIALGLLAVYLPMLLLASFHVHVESLSTNGIRTQATNNVSELDGSDCLLCQFLQLAYEASPSILTSVCQPEFLADEQTVATTVFTTFHTFVSLRAPPVLL